MFYVVPTPIGNLEDITLRALRVLKEVDVIAAEDTRHSLIVLKKYDIRTPLQSFHSHSDERKLEYFVSLLKDGKNVALISDAGTPGISDPGFLLLRRCVEENIPLTVLPGACAAITALVSSGFRMDKFTYLGFLPLKKHRKRMIGDLKENPYSVIVYESPHRLLKTLGEFSSLLGEDRKIAVCRELTKIHEEIFRGTLQEALLHFEKKSPRGEITLILAPYEKSSGSDELG